MASPAWLRALSHERAIVAAALGATIVLAWLYMLPGGGMDWAMTLMPRGHPADWSPSYAALTFLMWAVMMAAMMLPSAAPMLLLHARVVGGKAAAPALRQSSAFALAYLGVWTGASLVATGLQWGLDHGRLLDPMLTSTSTVLTALLLIGAGAWQFTPLKRRCLSRCRAPLDFLMSAWRPGVRGSAIMGLHHGLLCLGCCWGLMLLLFVAGAMNFAWIIVIATYVLVEKVVPRAEVLVPVSGIGLIAWGGVLLARGIAS
jgi:predicted metal-binding membrane protein